jgi:hypothetical protein
MEFISGTPYAERILLTGEGNGMRLLEAEHSWTAIFKPSQNRDWSLIATMIRLASPGAVLLCMDSRAPVLPRSFVEFLDRIMSGGQLLTRVWVGTLLEIPSSPDAILFPPLRTAHHATAAYEMMKRLRGRDGHGVWNAIPADEWNTLVEMAAKSDLGFVISDIGERTWTLFWHKLVDSLADSQSALMKKGLCWLHTGAAILEKNASLH